MDIGRILSSISNETLPLNHYLQQNHQDINSEITHELEERDFHHDHNVIYKDIDLALLNNGFIDVTEEQDKMSKIFSKITFTYSDEACMDLFHIMKTSNVPLVMYDRIIRWLKRNEGNIASHGTSGLISRNNFIESMNK